MYRHLANPPADTHRYVLHFTEGCCICFCITTNQGRNGFVDEVTGYFGYSFLFCLSIAFASPWFGAPSRGSSMPRDEQPFVPVLLRAVLEAAESQEAQLSEKAVASYQTGYLKTASCKQFPPTAMSLPVAFAGCLFQWSVFLLLSHCSGSATKISSSPRETVGSQTAACPRRVLQPKGLTELF